MIDIKYIDSRPLEQKYDTHTVYSNILYGQFLLFWIMFALQHLHTDTMNIEVKKNCDKTNISVLGSSILL